MLPTDMVSQQANDLKLNSYSYELPAHLVAERPLAKRDECKLMIYHAPSGEVIHTKFHQLKKYVPAQTCLVLNNTKVFPCRLIGQRPTGGKVEVFILSLHDDQGSYPVMIKSSAKKIIGQEYILGEQVKINAKLTEIKNNCFFVTFENMSKENLIKYLDQYGHIPIPPYIRGGQSDEKDFHDYQTCMATQVGSVAAPTAGLHFTPELLKDFKHAEVTLHVGAGTFLPVQTENIEDHLMHGEYFSIDQHNYQKIQLANYKIAVGTTSVRVLESVFGKQKQNYMPPNWQETDIFLYPGKDISTVDGLITNFHLPKSSLLMLVSALIGREKTLELYQLAVQKNYRFYSYGDAMMILLR